MKRSERTRIPQAVPVLGAVVLLLCSGLLAPRAHAQEDGAAPGLDGAASHAAAPVITAARIVGAGIEVDGRLDEEAWRQAEPATEFVQTEPREGARATERTEVYVIYDDAALFVGARMYDSSGAVRQRLGRRDSYLSDSDWLYVMLDTHHDHLIAYQFSVNPSGVKRDEVTTGGGRGDESWDAVWDVGTSVDAEGWTAELRIPFSQLRFGRDERQTWGVQVSRRIIRKEEVVVLAFTPKSMRGGVARYGHLQGLEGLRPGKKWEALPYVVSRAEYLNVGDGNPFRDGSEFHHGAGLDLKYRLTSALTLDATANPDFGQVELDPAVVNLSAFETSFDEKRPFFMEGADIFRFSGPRLFYSRRIGRAPQGSLPEDVEFADRPDASTILGAAKLTGRTPNGWYLGLLEAVTAEETAAYIDATGAPGSSVVEPLSNHVVARAAKSMRQGQSWLGAMVTGVNRSLPGESLDAVLHASGYTGGVDFNHQFLGRAWEVNGYVAYSRVAGSPAALARTQRSSARYFQRPDAGHVELDSTRTSLHGYAGRIALRKVAGEHWRGEANVAATSPGFEINDMGFQTSVDRVGADLNVSYVENQPGPVFRSFRVESRTSRDWNYGWDTQGGRSSLSFNGQLLNYWNGTLGVNRNFASYDDRLTRGGPIARNLADWNFNFHVSTDDRRSLSGRLNGGFGWGESGSWSRNASLNLSVRPAENWMFSAGPRYSTSHTAAQYVTTVEDAAAVDTYGFSYVFAPLDQTTVSMETRLNVTFTPELSLDLFAQPFVASADYAEPMRLRAPRTFLFERYEGPIDDTDFNRRSLRGNAVLRWEWKPGSTLFLVWQQSRSGSHECAAEPTSCRRGRFAFGRDVRGLLEAPPNNIFLVKMNYWLNL